MYVTLQETYYEAEGIPTLCLVCNYSDYIQFVSKTCTYDGNVSTRIWKPYTCLLIIYHLPILIIILLSYDFYILILPRGPFFY